MAAFKAAAEAGYGIEYDVRLSADGVAVIYHDENLKRLTTSEALTASMDANVLQNLQLADTKETIPTLQDLLAFWPKNLPLLTELKIDGPTNGPLLAEYAAALLVEHGGLATLMSFDEPTVAAIPESTYAGQLIHPVRVYGAHAFSEKLTRALTGRNDYICVWHEDAARTYEAAKTAGKPLMVYTTRSAQQHAELRSATGNDVGVIFEHYNPHLAYKQQTT